MPQLTRLNLLKKLFALESLSVQTVAALYYGPEAEKRIIKQPMYLQKIRLGFRVIKLTQDPDFKITLSGFPMPPSINEQLMPRAGRLIKTGKARAYDQKVQVFHWHRKSKIDAIYQEISPLLKDIGLSVDTYFVFHEDRLVSKGKKAKAWLKALDADNRRKSSIDALFKCLSIDDKFIIQGNIEKISCSRIIDEQVIFVIKPANLKNLDDLKKELTHI